MKDPLRYDCEECEEPCEEGSDYCEDCPYDPARIIAAIRLYHDDFPEVSWAEETLWPIVSRLFALQADIEILGAPLSPLSEEEMEGLRILKEEQMKRQMHEQEKQQRKAEAQHRRSMPRKWRGR